MSVKTPNYATIEDVSVYGGIQGKNILPAGSFVKPIERQYVPKHVLNKESVWAPFNIEKEVYCHTQYGFVCMLRSNLRER